MLKTVRSTVNVDQITGVLPVVNGGTGVTTSTGTGNTVLSAAPTLSGNVTLSTGNLIVANGQGIDFSATPNTGTSELLADYEEGTYTPTATASTGSITSFTSSGSYILIGRQVTVSITVTITNAGTGIGALQISLPFTVGSIAGMGAGTEDANTGIMLQIQAAAGTSTGFAKTYLGATPIATNNLLRLTVTYFV